MQLLQCAPAPPPARTRGSPPSSAGAHRDRVSVPVTMGRQAPRAREDIGSGLCSTCASHTAGGRPLRHRNPLAHDQAGCRGGGWKDTSPSICLHLQTTLLPQPKENSKSQNKINLGYGQLTYAIRKVILSWGLHQFSWSGGHPQVYRDLTSCDVHMHLLPGVSPGFCPCCPGDLPFHFTWDLLTRPTGTMHASPGMLTSTCPPGSNGAPLATQSHR